MALADYLGRRNGSHEGVRCSILAGMGRSVSSWMKGFISGAIYCVWIAKSSFE